MVYGKVRFASSKMIEKFLSIFSTGDFSMVK